MVPAIETQRIQEVQIMVIHLLCELVEEQLLASSANETAQIGHWENHRYELAVLSPQLEGSAQNAKLSLARSE